MANAKNINNASTEIEFKEDAIREVIVVARNYNRPNTKERIQSVKVSVLLKHRQKPIEVISVKGDATAFNEYEKMAMTEWLKRFPQSTKNRFLVRHLEEKGISTRIDKADVRYQKEL